MEFETLVVIVLIGLPLTIILYRMFFVHKKNPITDNFTVTRLIKYKEDDFVDKVEESMRKSSFRLIRIDQERKNLRAFVLPSLFSWSEVVDVAIEKNEEGYNVIFESKCAFPIQVYAWGKNKRNAERFFANLYNLS